MIKRLFIFLLIYISIIIYPFFENKFTYTALYQAAYAQESLKVNSINFDNSDSIIFLGTSGNEDTEEIKITKQKLTDPDRVYFDIDNAILTFANSTFELKHSRLQKVRIAQNSVNPNIVRIVIWNSENYDASQIKILKIKNNIIIKLSNEIPIQQYLTQTYKETKESAIEYNDKAVVIPEEKKVEISESNEIFNKVQQAFNEQDNQLVRPNIEQKQAKLKSRFFLEKASPRNGSFLIGGIGVVNVEKSFTLTEPSRVVFDLPNTIVAQELRDKEFKLSETETAKIGQFTPSIARIVIRTENIDNYRPIYSTNLQTLLITGSNNISGVNTTQIKSELAYFKEQNVNSTTDIINIMFSQPIIYSIKRKINKIDVIFYNLVNFDTESFNATALKNKNGYEAQKIGINTYIISFPVKSSTLVDCYETLNASQLRFVFTQKPISTNTTTPSTSQSEQKNEENPFANLMERAQKKTDKSIQKKQTKSRQTAINKIKNRTIIIDPGHGGKDTGAMRGSILEKDLTLAIALKVRDYLREKGMKNIIMTRTDDTTLTLEDRVAISNTNQADIFVSIHINASVKSEIKGIETHYYTENGYNVAKIIHKELINNISATDRGLFKSKFYVINHTEAPAVLLELGFISNDQERNSLISEKRQTESAEAIAEGIINYLTEYNNE